MISFVLSFHVKEIENVYELVKEEFRLRFGTSLSEFNLLKINEFELFTYLSSQFLKWSFILDDKFTFKWWPRGFWWGCSPRLRGGLGNFLTTETCLNHTMLLYKLFNDINPITLHGAQLTRTIGTHTLRFISFETFT